MKSWYDSMTIRGLIVSMIGLLSQQFGLADQVLPEQIGVIADLILQIGGVAIAYLGRKRASAPLL